MCHQTVSLIARHLEANGIATVIAGCARDIVSGAGVPRYLWSDFPLGHSAGKPHDAVSQTNVVRRALQLLRVASGPVFAANPERWSDDPAWQRDFMRVEGLAADEIGKLRRSFDRDKDTARQRRTDSA